MPVFLDLSDKKFGRLTVTTHYEKKSGSTYWLCKCSCGIEKLVSTRSLTRKQKPTISCGRCIHSKPGIKNHAYKHGHAIGGNKSRLLRTYENMISRCYDPRRKDYKHYGARGINVCDRWLNSFDLFCADMGERPVGMSIERIDNDLGYSPDNCRWATQGEQVRNSRRTVIVNDGNKEICLKDFADSKGLNYNSLHAYYRRRGLSINESVKRSSNA